MPDRAAAVEDKRALIRSAAVRAFAKKGYHACRVSDIAEEAGVAYGLVYHYFGSKEAVLETVFRETWQLMLTAIQAVEELGEPAPEQIRKVAAMVLRTWRDDPDLVRVLVREVTRSPQLQNEIGEIVLAFKALERIIERGKAEGSFRADLDSRLAATMVYGTLEEILTGWVMGQLPDSDEDIAKAEHDVTLLMCEGLAKPS
jgi:TetR/AcrR family transcriptional regulator, fatty acid metabolism regulator protein